MLKYIAFELLKEIMKESFSEEPLRKLLNQMRLADFALETLPPIVQEAWQEFTQWRFQATGEAGFIIPELGEEATREIYEWYQSGGQPPVPPAYLRLEELIEKKYSLPAGTLKEVSDFIIDTIFGDES